MNRRVFLELVRAFARRPVVATEGRHVYLWHGASSTLEAAVPAGSIISLDLHQLAAVAGRAPKAQDEAQRLVRNLIQNNLGEAVSSNLQQFVIVTGCDLLSRYKVPLTAFYQVTSESTMVIFAVSPRETRFRPSQVLPDYISMDPTATLSYLKNILGETSLVEESEERS